jgi:hypothetical protein
VVVQTHLRAKTPHTQIALVLLIIFLLSKESVKFCATVKVDASDRDRLDEASHAFSQVVGSSRIQGMPLYCACSSFRLRT